MQIRYTLGKESNLSFKIYADKFNVCFFINLVLTIINQKKKKNAIYMQKVGKHIG